MENQIGLLRSWILFAEEGGVSLFAGRRSGMQPGTRHPCPAGENVASHVSMSLLDQATNLRRLVIPNDDSSVSSFAYPFSALLGGIGREILRDRLPLPLHQVESQSPQWGGCLTRASRGEELHLYNSQVIKDLYRPQSLIPGCSRHFEGTDHRTAR
jgi:hypothetical protein